jgi:phosphoribosylglycinamide formyltransferase-1
VLISGTGTNLRALVRQLHEQHLRIVAVASNRPDAAGLEHAREAGIPTAAFALDGYPTRAARDVAMADWLDAAGASTVVLAGYMQLLTPAFLARFPGRILNVHPSLLPAYPGPTPIEDALADGASETGVTVHVVDEGVDSGPILVQEPVAVKYDDTPESLRERIHAVEHRLLPQTVLAFVQGQLT